MTNYFHENLPKECFEIKSVYGNLLMADKYFYQPSKNSIWRRTRKSECVKPMFCVMKGSSFKPMVQKNSSKNSYDMKNLKDLLKKDYLNKKKLSIDIKYLEA